MPEDGAILSQFGQRPVNRGTADAILRAELVLCGQLVPRAIPAAQDFLEQKRLELDIDRQRLVGVDRGRHARSSDSRTTGPRTFSPGSGTRARVPGSPSTLTSRSETVPRSPPRTGLRPRSPPDRLYASAWWLDHRTTPVAESIPFIRPCLRVALTYPNPPVEPPTSAS
jgi:hypothetical protein